MYERTTWTTAKNRCSAAGLVVCEDPKGVSTLDSCTGASNGLCAGLDYVYNWLADDSPSLGCSVKVQVQASGSLSFV